MRALIGFLTFVAALFTLHSAADGRAELRCQPVIIPPQKPCSWELYREQGHVPLRCKNA